MYNQGLFKNEIPKPVQLLLMFFILAPLIAANGVFSGNATDMIGVTGLTSEIISMASNASTIGLALALPVIFKIKFFFKVRYKLAVSFLLIALLLFITSTSDNLWVITIGSLFMGFIRMLCLFEVIMISQFILAPDGDKGKFYSIFYIIAVSIGMIATYAFTVMGYYYSYVAPHYFLAFYFIILALLVLLVCHNQYFTKKTPLYYTDWFSILCLATSYLMINYGLAFLKQYGWFNNMDNYLILATGVFLFILIIIRQTLIKRPLLDLSGFNKISVYISVILLFLVGLYLASGSLQSAFISVLGYDNITNASLSLWMGLGVVLGGVIGWRTFKKDKPLKYYIILGFLFYIIYSVIMYFMISPVIMIEYLYVASVFRGMGMIILFIGVWYYASVDLNMNQTFGVLSILLVVRSFLSTAIWGALISYALYQYQWQSINDLAVQLDSVVYNGNGMSEYSQVQIGALLSAVKQIFGYLIITGIPICIFVAMHSFGKVNMRRVVFGKKILRGNTIKGYKLRSI